MKWNMTHKTLESNDAHRPDVSLRTVATTRIPDLRSHVLRRANVTLHVLTPDCRYGQLYFQHCQHHWACAGDTTLCQFGDILVQHLASQLDLLLDRRDATSRRNSIFQAPYCLRVGVHLKLRERLATLAHSLDVHASAGHGSSHRGLLVTTTSVLAESKIQQLEMTLLGEDDVVWLHIPVNKTTAMYAAEGLQELGHVEPRLLE
mmetsp:Transcript_67395/g.111642  ORF Transcript_67395/g.111642 Transcript_67395/m.111642 type:complete len:204 (+) Transcript_67395:498-1109(+)